MQNARVLGDVRRRKFALRGRGVEIAALQWGDAGPQLLLHHANGFCAATWALVAGRLATDYRVVAIDVRGHGESSTPEGPAAYDWHELLADLIGVAEQLVAECGPIALGAGNSFGGTLTACAAASRPELFERVALLDPVIRPTPELLEGHVDPAQLEAMRARGGPDLIVEQARRRRAVWPSRDAAREAWRGKEMFASWQPEALELYLAFGLRDRDDGSVELACLPDVEASVFEMSGSIDPFAYAPRLRAPALVVAAELGYFPPVLFDLLANAMPRGRRISLPAGHLMPMEDPESTAGLLRAFAEEPV
jgi:pimeloyl-ACP methyl ester carboxylesterase